MALTVGPRPRLHEVAALPGTGADVYRQTNTSRERRCRRLAVERRSKIDSRQIIRGDRMEPGRGTASNMIVVQNRFEELKRRVPVH